MNRFRESMGVIGLFFCLFLGVILIFNVSNLSFDSAAIISNRNFEANNESLANLWGSESISGIIDTVNRSSDTILLSGLLLVAALAVNAQFRIKWKK